MKTVILGCYYFQKEINSRGCLAIDPCISNPFLFILNQLHLFGVRFPLKYMLSKKQIDKCSDADVVILFGTIVCKDIIIEVSRQIEAVTGSKVKLIFYYWDLITPANVIHNDLSSRWEIWSFDYNDSKRYNLYFANTFYFSELIKVGTDKSYDTFFVGLDKGRKLILDKIKDSFVNAGLRPFISVVSGNIFQRKKRYMNYLTLRRYVKGSRSLIDVVKEGQHGLTLRTLEAIFFEKKLITNNRGIKDYSFYKYGNVLITETGDISLDELKRFIAHRYNYLPVSIKEYYDFDNWLKRIISGVEAEL